jgi:hypothetical protein
VVVVVLLELIEPVAEPAAPGIVVSPVPPLVPVPAPPDVPVLPIVPVLPAVPPVLPIEPLVPVLPEVPGLVVSVLEVGGGGGVVVLLLELLDGVVPWSRLLQADSDSAATAARTSAAERVMVRVVIGRLLGWFSKVPRSGRAAPQGTLGRLRHRPVGGGCCPL